MSGLFTVYALLARPTAFNAYVGCSAGWFAENNDYFLELSTRAFRTVAPFANRRVFMANSLQDQYDPDQAIHRQMIGFSEVIKRNLRETISYRYETYENYPHVPFQVFLRWLAVRDNGATEEVTSQVCSRCENG